MKELKEVRDTMHQMVLEQSSFVTKILKTKKYEMFGYLKGNRNINPTNLSKIISSIAEKHIETNCVICAFDPNDDKQPLKIIDGQHRFEACKELQKSVTYVIDESIDMSDINQVLSDITLMNTASKEWDIIDFLRSEIQKGNPNYKLWGEVFNKFNDHFDHAVIFHILNDRPGRIGKKLGYNTIKSGELIFSMEEKIYLEDRLEEISKYNKFTFKGGKRYYQKAINTLLNSTGFNSDVMLRKLEQFGVNNIEKNTTTEGALNQLREIHNKNLQKNRLWFSTSGTKAGMKIFVE